MKQNLKSGVKKRRQISALERLEKQLQVGVKRIHLRQVDNYGITPLSEKDIKRIKQEIQTLKSRI